MASTLKRLVELRRGKKKVVLESTEGHVWMRIGDGMTGFPLHDAKKEAAMLEQLLAEWQGHGYAVVKDTGSVAAKAPKKKTAPKKKATPKKKAASKKKTATRKR